MKTTLWPILRRALRSPRAPIVIDDQRTWRYIDLVVGALYLADHIQRRSTRQNVGILLPTGGAFPMAAIAAWMLGRTIVPINYLQSAADRQYVINDADLDLIVTVEPLLNFLGERPTGVTLLELDKIAPTFRGIPPFRFPAIADADDLAVILYTSGTSGKPKGVMLRHRNLSSNVMSSAAHMKLTRADAFLGVLPQFHSFGLTALTLIPLSLGAPVIYTARFSPRRIIDLIKTHRPDIVMFIPSMYTALLTAKDACPDDFKSIRLAISGGEPLPRETFEKFRQRFNVTIREGYGLTETSPVAAVNTPEHERAGSVGKLIPGCHARIVDDHGKVLGPDQEGEIQLAGDNIMAGYHHLPDLTEQVLGQDGWFKTGDWGKLDRDGFLFITGRKKEMLIIGGENVFPREIEEILNAHPAVKESAVVGRFDPVRGEVAVAFIELNEDTAFDESQMRQWLRDRIAPFKVPREIRVVESLPRNPTGKVMRRQLVEMMRELAP